MKLTTHIRNAFVSAVMNDVPKIDYQEQAEKLVQKEARAAFPPKLRGVFDDAELRCYLRTDKCISLTRGLQSRYFTAPHDYKISEELLKKLIGMGELAAAQDATRKALETKLSAAAASVTTRKALAELLPEFAKYLPVEAEVTKNLPAVQNIVADFSKAGWPKGTKK